MVLINSAAKIRNVPRFEIHFSSNIQGMRAHQINIGNW